MNINTSPAKQGVAQESKKQKRKWPQILLASQALLTGLAGFQTLRADEFNKTPGKSASPPIVQIQPVPPEEKAKATRQFDELIEAYTNNSVQEAPALEKLRKIQYQALDQRYQGYHMLFEHYLERQLFVAKHDEQFKRLGVDITPEKEWRGHLDIKYPKPSKALLAQGGIGKENYDALLKLENFINLNSEELTAFAKAQFDRLEKEMNQRAKVLDPTQKDWRGVYNTLRKQHPSKKDLLGVYKKEAERAKAFLIEKNLITIPKERLQVIETPAYYRDSIPFAAYLPQGNGRGSFMVTTVIDEDPAKEEEQLRAHNYGFIPAVVVHEAFPGHHLQNAHTDAVSGKIDETDPKNNTMLKVYGLIPRNHFFIEGWGVYSEVLMQEQGYYQKIESPMKPEALELFAMRNILWRAARAWIDPQVHTGKMSYEQAVDFLVDHVLLERDRAEIEVNRYFQKPTDVASYLVGEMQLHQLRDQLQKEDPQNFQLKKFHDTLFQEGRDLPVPVIARILFNQPLLLEKPPKK
jgi:hypothetical protein